MDYGKNLEQSSGTNGYITLILQLLFCLVLTLTIDDKTQNEKNVTFYI